MAKNINKSLNKSEFTTALEHCRLKKRATNGAYRVMVDGISREIAAKELGYKSRQSVHKAVDVIWKKHLEVSGALPGWITINVFLPRERAEEIITESQELKEQYIKENY